MDPITGLGELTLATRLHRLADNLQKDVTDVYAELGLDFQARWFPVLIALREGPPQAVTALARQLGLTHQAISKTVKLLGEHQLVDETADPQDGRRKYLELTATGRRLCERLDRVWEEIRLANRQLLAEAGVDLLADLAQLEAALASESMAARVRRRLDLVVPEPVRLEDYRPSYKKHFVRLNEEWLAALGGVETSDRQILDDPGGLIVRRGGAVLFVLVEGEVVGTCALIRHAEGFWELAKMAVDPAYRGRGLGRRLAEAIIARARRAGADRLWLRTSPRLETAGHLYRSLGFRRAHRHPFPPDTYARETYTMVLDLDTSEEEPS